MNLDSLTQSPATVGVVALGLPVGLWWAFGPNGLLVFGGLVLVLLFLSVSGVIANDLIIGGISRMMRHLLGFASDSPLSVDRHHPSKRRTTKIH